MGTEKNRPESRERKPQKPTQDTGTTHLLRGRQTMRSDCRDSAPKRDRLLTEAEVAEWFGVSPLTLRKWRCQRTHPLPFLKIAKVIRYRESDVLRFLESHMVVPHSMEGYEPCRSAL